MQEELFASDDESEIPLRVQALAGATDAAGAGNIEKALEQFEARPPPRLDVTLMGEFAVTRSGTPIQPEHWQRPAARRLFQYFVLNQGRPLPREQILDELWPDSPPDAAGSSFKTVYSLLRKAIEPELRPKSPSRYLQVEQETYTFNPTQSPALLRCDAVEFERIVCDRLRTADNHDVRPLPADLRMALEAWRPLLPALADAPWTTAPRERLQHLYLQGCLYAAGAMLDADRPVDAAAWAERTVGLAPWLEEGWQELMRAQARQGNRVLALTTYDAAVAALKAELDVAPSTMLAWMAQRLRADQEI